MKRIGLNALTITSNGSKLSASLDEMLRAMPSGSQSGAAFGRNRLPFGRAMLVIGVFSALSWAIVIAVVLALLYARSAWAENWWMEGLLSPEVIE